MKLPQLFAAGLCLLLASCQKPEAPAVANGQGGEKPLTIGVAFETLQTE